MDGSTHEQLSPDSDARVQAVYDPVQHLNILFSTSSSVIGSIAGISSSLALHQDELATRISGLELSQAHGSDSALERMKSARTDLAVLFSEIETIRGRAIQTEQDITDMTAEIKRLDATKRNLTLSMTVLKRLQMLTTAYDQLRALARSRQYRECASLLQVVLQLMRHFNSYRSIEQIAVLSRGVSDLQRELLEQVCEDFELAFTKGEIGVRRPLLGDACLVMDALGVNARGRIMTWYINTELREYRHVFKGDDEAASLDNVGRRYAWFKRTIKTHDEDHAAIFPPHWRTDEMLAAAFCEGTKDDLKAILERTSRRSDGGSGLDVNLLLRCLVETLEFEQHLDRRFAGDSRTSVDSLSSAAHSAVEDKDHRLTFNGAISLAFEPYLSLWVDAQERNLAATIPKYRSQPLIPPDDEFTPSAVITSAIELFHLYKVMLSQCAKLSTGPRLFDLAQTLAKYLDEYARQVLLYNLQAGGANGPPLQNIILVLNTADFWHANTNQLEENIRKRLDPELALDFDLSPQADGFLGVASAAVSALVRFGESGWDGAWREMRNMNWANMETAGDQSSYVAELLRHISGKASEVLALVIKQQYARAFCDNFVEHISWALINNLVQCRPISEIGAEQMLLDKYALAKSLENLLSHSSHPSTGQTDGGAAYVAPVGFAKRVNQSMSRIDPLLKTLQVRPSPPEGLVQAYLIHIADKSEANFRKVLDLKNVRKQDQAVLVELFAIHRDGPAWNGKLAESSPLLTPLMASGSSLASGPNSGLGTSGGKSSILAAAGVPGPASAAIMGAGAKGFDAAMLGERLLNAAREMGDKATVGSAEKATINDNLKNIGKFFRSDFGGLGARFGKRDVSGGGPPSGE